TRHRGYPGAKCGDRVSRTTASKASLLHETTNHGSPRTPRPPLRQNTSERERTPTAFHQPAQRGGRGESWKAGLGRVGWCDEGASTLGIIDIESNPEGVASLAVPRAMQPFQGWSSFMEQHPG